MSMIKRNKVVILGINPESPKFEYEELSVATTDIEKVSERPEIYISYTDNRGALHLCKEIINNSIDELRNPKSPGKVINMFYDEEEDTLTVSDDGRGIPLQNLLIIFTTLASGTKKTLSTGGITAGINGLGGSVCVSALAHRAEIQSFVDGKVRELKFTEGELVSDKTTTLKKASHGTSVSFKPSQLFLNNDVIIPIEELLDWVSKTSFLLPEKIVIKFDIKYKGKDMIVHHKFQNKTGIMGYLPKFEPNCDLMRNPIGFSDQIFIKEDDVPVRQEDGNVVLTSFDRVLELHFAINYNTNDPEYVPHTFCNDILTCTHGIHEEAVSSAWSAFLLKETKATLTKKESEKINLMGKDALSGLRLLVSLNTTMSPKYINQTKQAVTNQALYKPIKDLATDMIANFFKDPTNKRLLKILTDFVKFNAKARYETTKARNKIKSATTFIEDKEIRGYTPPNNREKGAYRELYIVEGDSAGGGARAGRFDNDTQGIFRIRGKITNSFEYTPSELMDKSEECKNLVKILGCDIGRNYNRENLKFNKIIIFTDADVDGDHIAALLSAFFLKFYPDLVEDGIVFRAITPLYKLVDSVKKKKKKDEDINMDDYLFNKASFFKLYEKHVASKIRLALDSKGKYITDKQMTAFLAVNRDYYEQLDSLSKHYSLNPDVIEFIAYEENFMKKIGKLDKDLKVINGDTIDGAYQGEFTNIIVDDEFMDNILPLRKIIFEYNQGNLYYHMYEKFAHTDMTYKGEFTIGQIMNKCQKYEPEIELRYKGLGELDIAELKVLSMDPRNRVLIRLGLKDLEHAVNTFSGLFNKTNDAVQFRKNLISNTILAIDEIDN